ncbi:MAG: hypothetical protein GWN00_03615 [Aliifodinibius sp.]|nr:hypothetical protein [Fodinibius sp.]NIV10286.1 hypothetical protein [Fodinibius sp.]NIY23925.1 hypothetical protein [Fodinibius sp.]
MYFGTPESPIYASPDDTTFVNLFLSYAGPLDLVITLPEDNFSTTQRVIPIEGTVRSGQEVDYSSLSATLSVNDNISQKIAIDTLSGFFFTSALLPQRNNRIEVSVADSINNQLVSDQITVSFTGTFPFLRAALSWDGQADLDLHMINPNGLECYFSNPQVGGMELDVDNTSGFGPENISVTTDTIPGLYNVFVRNFSSTLGITANVKIFKYNPNIDEEELIDEQSRLFSDVNDWIVGDYTLP